MAVCRVEKTKDYTTMSNFHLRDPNLSNKARGLLSTMLSLPEDWDYTTRGLAKICKDGVDGITAQLKELEQYGYLIRHRIRDSNGRIVDMEYVIYERPHTASPDTEKPYMVKPDMGLPRLETPAQINIDKRITDESNTDLSNTHSILSDEARPYVLAALEAKRKEPEYRDMDMYVFAFGGIRIVIIELFPQGFGCLNSHKALHQFSCAIEETAGKITDGQSRTCRCRTDHSSQQSNEKKNDLPDHAHR